MKAFDGRPASDTGWLTPILVNSWQNYGTPYAGAAYRKVNGVVHVQGMVKTGDIGVAIFTLPAGCRPAGDLMFAAPVHIVNDTSGAASAGTAHTHPLPINDIAGRVTVQADGDVIFHTVDATTNYVSLSGISFLAD